MRVRIILPTDDSQRLREDICKLGEKVEHEETREKEWEAVRQFPPMYWVFLLITLMADNAHRSKRIP